MNLDAERINVPLTKKVLDDTRWFVIDADAKKLPAGLVWTQVLASPQLPDVLLAKTEEGDFFWYDDLRYATNDPFALIAMFDAWNKAHGYA